ncbi:RagB/SusD family nutrient uptake outer membrane protein [Pedobacter metabolipauper]|uniref:SusD-like starch-binding protein associating with outer membrane n=1 Tax=Pedobacter metabolipauper TaxID=425513 RepID=A0A4R6SXJ2_9SPHI|nr:RagB/SusD family nutrient uptake outer membrane protein [Pedobacter metabolipauper]TDQ09893.1 SusD-like starch-binding protein associating with outer membrane [Pedobacter metabolipauper]
MKSYQIVSAAFLAIVLSAGCKKYLDKEPIGMFREDQVLTDPTANSIAGSVNNTYPILSNTLNLLGSWNWTGGLVLRGDFVLQDIASGDANKKWNPDGDQAWMDDVAKFTFTPDNGAFSGIWTYNYEGISRVNQPISQLEDDAIMQKVGMDAATKNRLLGEALFLRAYFYFDLVNNFGDVPLLLKPLKDFSDAYAAATRAPKATVMEQINADLQKAAELLPNSKYSSATEKWRVSKGAAIAMQAKSALYNENWQGVIDKVNELQTLNYYQLDQNYFDNFDITKEFADNEVIFAYDHVPSQQPRRGNGLTALLGWGFLAPSPNFVAAFEANDPRLNYTVNVADQSVYKLLGNTTSANKGNDDAPSNRIFIRWADVLLWKAEALNEKADYPAALALINQVRARARNTVTISGTPAPAGTLPDRPASTDKAQIKTWLMQERRVELGMESHRFSDLRRWKTAKAVLTAMGKSFQDKHYLYPIPQGEIDKSAGTITQNNY